MEDNKISSYNDGRVDLKKELPTKIKIFPLFSSLVGAATVFMWSQAVIFSILAVQNSIFPRIKIGEDSDIGQKIRKRFRRLNLIPSKIPFKQLIILWGAALLFTIFYVMVSHTEKSINETYYNSKIKRPDNTIFMI